MDVFNIRQRLIEDHAEYRRSSLDIADPRIRGFADQRLGDGLLWLHLWMTPPDAPSLRTRRRADSGHDTFGIVGGRSL